MGISSEALEELRGILLEMGLAAQVEAASEEDLEELGLFLLDITAAAIKVRVQHRINGRELPPSSFDPIEPVPEQQSFDFG